MNTINNYQILYETAKKHHLKQMSLKEAKEYLESKGIKKSSAQDYIYNYSHLVSGRVFKRTLKNDALDHYLEMIHKETPNLLENALMSLNLHINYYEAKAKTTMHTTRTIYDKYIKSCPCTFNEVVLSGDEIAEVSKLTEGNVKKIFVNSYERNHIARGQCLEFYGYKCSVCDLDFKDFYGEIGFNFIHVHHRLDISEIGKQYIIDPINDLVPVCPNCHAMLHKKKPAYSVEELKTIIRNNKKL